VRKASIIILLSILVALIIQVLSFQLIGKETIHSVHCTNYKNPDSTVDSATVYSLIQLSAKQEQNVSLALSGEFPNVKFINNRKDFELCAKSENKTVAIIYGNDFCCFFKTTIKGGY